MRAIEPTLRSTKLSAPAAPAGAPPGAPQATGKGHNPVSSVRSSGSTPTGNRVPGVIPPHPGGRAPADKPSWTCSRAGNRARRAGRGERATLAHPEMPCGPRRA